MAKKNKFPTDYVKGEYAVGTCIFSFTDVGRKEVFGNADGDRKVTVRMYYPVKNGDVVGKEKAVIFSKEKIKALVKAYHIPKVDENTNYADYYENVPIATDSKFPLIMFSMGFNSYVEANTYLLCALASEGYVIASVGHAYEAVENDYEDGSFDLFDKKINKIMMKHGTFKTVRAQNKLLKKQASYEELLKDFEIFQDEYAPYMKERLPQWEADVLCGLYRFIQRHWHVRSFDGRVPGILSLQI